MNEEKSSLPPLPSGEVDLRLRASGEAINEEAKILTYGYSA
jgi:hypothetical protein